MRYSYTFLYDQAYSEDIVQEVFIYLWENSHKIRITYSLKSYLFRMVRNRCFNFLKSIKITDKSGVLDHDLAIENEYEIAELLVNKEEELYEAVLKVVDTFPERMRKIFKLKYMRNYQYKEIADELAISVNTVKTQLKRARAKINESLITIILLCLLVM